MTGNRAIVRDIQKGAWLRHALLVLLCCFFAFPASAKHLVGGSVTYEYTGTSNGYFNFRISVDMYRDCSDQSGAQLASQINFGVYEHTGNNESLLTTLTLYQNSLEAVDAVSGGSSCSFKPNTCLQHGAYEGTVSLPPSKYGYDLCYEVCCRNTMQNLPDNSGYNFYAYIAPTAYKNTSPSFNGTPVPYICASDTASLDFSASEPDGDSISYQLAWPYSGASSGAASPTPAPTFSGTPQYVTYNPGYTYLYPFGTSYYCKIDASSGLFTVCPPSKQTRYVVAIDYLEWRNGKLISTTRRDVQFIVLPCPYNPAPVRQAVNGSTSNNFYVEAGQKFNFNLVYADPQVDTATKVTFSATGNIFNRKTNPATIALVPTGDSTIADANIQWQTTCSDESPNPYQIIVKAQDHGCPPHATLQTIDLYVQPPTPTVIMGPKTVCGVGDTLMYYAHPVGNVVLAWSADNGTVINTNSADTVLVVWQNPNKTARIKVIGLNTAGCKSDTVSQIVTIYPMPKPSAFSGPNLICLNNAATFTLSGGSFVSYSWSYDQGTLIADSGNKITVSWNEKGTKLVKAVEKDANGCVSDTLKIAVNVSQAVSDSIFGSQSVCPNAKGIDYFTNYQPGSVYAWKVTGGTIVSGNSSYHVKVNWGNKGAGSIKEVETTAAGCIGDTVTQPIIIDYALHTAAIKGDSVMCENSASQIYAVNNSFNSHYVWQISGGTIASGQGTYRIMVNWGSAGTGQLIVTETAYDSVNSEACAGAPVIMNIVLNPVPATTPLQGNKISCINAINSYKVSGFPSSYYKWDVVPQGLVINNQGADSVSITFSKAGTYSLSVVEISKDSCYGATQRITVFIDSLPVTSNIKGPSSVCAPNMTGIAYSVQGSPNSSFNWQVENGIITSGNGTNAIIVNWQQSGTGQVSVTETSAFGCTGLQKTLDVKVDSLQLNIDFVSTLRANDNEIEVQWHASNNQFLTGNISVYRSADPDHDGYRIIATVPPGMTSYIDKNVSTHSTSYYYKIGAYNSCNDLVTSFPHRTILLKYTPGIDSILSLSWNNYQGWAEGVDHYNTYKTVNADTSLGLFNFTGDTLQSVYTDLVGYRQCFRVSAVRKASSGMLSWSNDVCVDIEPILWIPNAFTPNNDPINNTWRVVVSNYKSYQADIYNRWGEHIYSTNDPKQQWDGTFKGNACPEGVYLYMIQVVGIRENIYRNGTINLLK